MRLEGRDITLGEEITTVADLNVEGEGKLAKPSRVIDMILLPPFLGPQDFII